MRQAVTDSSTALSHWGAHHAARRLAAQQALARDELDVRAHARRQVAHAQLAAVAQVDLGGALQDAVDGGDHLRASSMGAGLHAAGIKCCESRRSRYMTECMQAIWHVASRLTAGAPLG